MVKKIITFCLLALAFLPMNAQSFVNPSFEAEPQDAFIPVGWHICSPNTTPDIFPGVWGVYDDPYHGNTYMGLITRPDGSFESVGQRFPKKLKVGECYSFTIAVKHSDVYAGFNDPIRLNIYASDAKDSRDHLLLQVKKVDHTDWKIYKVEFKAQDDFNYLIIEANFPSDHKKAKGNILIDQISVIKTCDQV